MLSNRAQARQRRAIQPFSESGALAVTSEPCPRDACGLSVCRRWFSPPPAPGSFRGAWPLTSPRIWKRADLILNTGPWEDGAVTTTLFLRPRWEERYRWDICANPDLEVPAAGSSAPAQNPAGLRRTRRRCDPSASRIAKASVNLACLERSGLGGTWLWATNAAPDRYRGRDRGRIGGPGPIHGGLHAARQLVAGRDRRGAGSSGMVRAGQMPRRHSTGERRSWAQPGESRKRLFRARSGERRSGNCFASFRRVSAPRAGLVFCPPAEHRELMSGLAIPFSMWQCAGHGDAAGPGFVR